MFYVYLIKCEDNSLYVGFTANLEARISRHRAGHGGKFTLEHGAEQIVYYETYNKKMDAMKREKQLKGWSHLKKQSLIDQNLAQLKKLSISRQSPRLLKS